MDKAAGKVARWAAVRTHRGLFPGCAASDGRITFCGIEIPSRTGVCRTLGVGWPQSSRAAPGVR